MKKRFYLVAFIAIIFLGFSSCNKKDDPGEQACSGLWATELQDEVTAWTNAAIAYGSNPSVANCNAYKASAQAYLNALEPYGECTTLTGTERTQWEQALGEAQQSIDDIEC